MDIADSDDVRKIVEYAPNLIYVYDQVRNKNTYLNRCIGEKLGYSVRDVQQMGKDVMPSLIHPDDLQSVFSHFSKICQLKDGEIAALEYRVRHNKGHWVWFLSHDTVYRRDASGKVTHHIGAASDISAQKKLEADALEAQAKEAVTNQELREFAYAVSHDMKAPANTMKLILAELEEEVSCAQGSAPEELFGLAQITVDRMLQLIEDVLHYTTVVGQNSRFQKVDLNSVIREITQVLNTDIKNRHAKVTVDALPEVKGSETQLRMMFQNIVLNALTFSHPGVTPHVEVFAREGKAPGKAIISVRDNGIGIAEERFDQVFKMFKKLESSRNRDGSGLGLAICRRIALNHRSSISVDSEVGKGSIFSIELDVE